MMNTDRIGVITFFGILIPGSYLAGVLVLCIASCLDLAGQNGHFKMFEVITGNVAISTTVYLFVSYLLGVLVRLFAPNYVDKLSTRYLKDIRRKSDRWVVDYFPYQDTLTSRLNLDGMSKVVDFLLRLNPKYGKKMNTVFFNYCKWFIDSKDPALSKQVQQAEALVRFLSGTTLVLLIAAPLFTVVILAFLVKFSALYVIIYTGLLVGTLLCLCLILERFKYQRRREVTLVWCSVYIIVNGGDGVASSANHEALINAVFFPDNLESISSNKPLEETH